MNTQCLALDLHRLDLRLAGARVADRERSRSHSHRLAMRGYLALIAIAVARLAASRARTGATTLMPGGTHGRRRPASGRWLGSGITISPPAEPCL
jgi:hypothetical protein